MGARPRRPSSRILAGGVVATLLFAGCGGNDDDAGAPAPAGDASLTTTAGAPEGAAPDAVAIRTFSFQPPGLRVKAGTTVTWTNGDQTTHTVTAGKPGSAEAMFDQALEGEGKTFQFAFPTRGTYSYFCRRHESMTAEVVVS